MASSVVIKRVVAIGCDDDMQDWTVKHFETIEGREFVKLSSTCTGFRRFAGGTLYRTDSKVANMTFLAELAQRRTQAIVAATVEVLAASSLFDDGAPMSARAKKRAKKDAKNQAGAWQNAGCGRYGHACT